MPHNLLTAHMIVKNEDRFVWYAISSVLPYVYQFIIYDTGSKDKTVEIVDSFKDKKIKFRSVTTAASTDITKLRQQQLEEMVTNWFWLVDGDEVYPASLGKEIEELVKTKGDELEGIAVRKYDLLGDICHYQNESVGTYNLFGKKGHFVLRLVNKKNIPGLHVAGTYPFEGYYDGQNVEIVNHQPEKFYFTQGRFFHAMYLKRSSLGGNLVGTFNRNKWKIEWGKKIPENVSVPEVFNTLKPSFVPDVTARRSLFYNLIALLITPIKMIKRKIWKLYRE